MELQYPPGDLDELIFWGEEMNQVQILGKAVAFTATIV